MSGPTSQRRATRSSFLERLKNWSDQESWRRFILDYGRVIRASAVKAGLRSDEADDVVQETLLSVARSIPGFIYDRSKGTFEGWVCRIAQLRVIGWIKAPIAIGTVPNQIGDRHVIACGWQANQEPFGELTD